MKTLSDIIQGKLKNFLKGLDLFGLVNLKGDEIYFEFANIKAFWEDNVYSRILNYLMCPQMFLLQRSVHIYVVLVVLYLNLRIVYYLFLALRQKLLSII